MATRTRAISNALLVEACDLANLYDYTVRTYSGRGMYGHDCAGIVLDGQREANRFLMALAALTVEKALWADESDPDPSADAMELAESVAMDSMGHGIVLYFPGWVLED
jgi:hypothetical protein